MADYGTSEHVDYPHTPGTLYDCVACETACNCSGVEGDTMCIYCAETFATLASEFRSFA